VVEPVVQADVLVAAAERLDTQVTEARLVVALDSLVLAAALVAEVAAVLAVVLVCLEKVAAVLVALAQPVLAVALVGALAKMDSLLMVV
jgi:hypothetical protein